MKKKVRIYKAPDGKGKYINKTAQFLNRMDYGGQPSIDELGYPGAQSEPEATTEEQLAQIVYQDISANQPSEAIVAKLVNVYDLDPVIANQFVQQVYATLENKIDQDEVEEDDTETVEAEEIENETLLEKKPMSKIKGYTDLAMEEAGEDDEGLDDEDMVKYGGMPRKDDGGEADYIESMNNDQMNWPESEVAIEMPDMSVYMPFDISDYLTNDAAAIAWQYPEEEEYAPAVEDETDYTEPVANPEEFKMGGFKTKKGYVNSVVKLVKKAAGGDSEEQDVKASDADPRGDDLRKNRLDAFVSAVKREGDVSIAKEQAAKQFEEMQAMHNQMMMQNPNLQNFIPQDYDNDYMQFGGQRRAMRQFNRAMGRMPMFPGRYGPVTKFDVRRSGIFGRPKEYSIEFGQSPLMQLASNPILSQAYGYGMTGKKKVITPGKIVTEKVRKTVNNKSTQDVAKDTKSDAAVKSANWDMDKNGIPDNIQSNRIGTAPSALPTFITDPVGTAIAASKTAGQGPVIKAPITPVKKVPVTVSQPKIESQPTLPAPPVVMSQPLQVEENKNTTPSGTTWTVTKNESTPQQEFCYGNQCFQFPEEQYDDAMLFNEMPSVLSRHQYNINPNVEWYNRENDQFDFSKLSPKEIEELINSDNSTIMKSIKSRNRLNVPSFANAYYNYQLNNQKAFGPQSYKSAKYDASDAKNPATSKYADFLNQYGRFKPGANPDDIFQAVGPSYPGYENYEEGGMVDNPMPDAFGNLQRFIYGGNDIDQSDIDFTNSIDVTDPYMPKAAPGMSVNSMQNPTALKDYITGHLKYHSYGQQNPNTNQQTVNQNMYNPYGYNMGYGYNPQSLFKTYFPANFPQRYTYSKMMKGPYNKTTGQQFGNIPGFNPYAQVKDINVTKTGMFGRPKRYSVTYSTNPTGRPEDRKLAFASPGSSQQDQQKQQGIANKSTEPRAGFSNTEGLSGKAKRQIRQGEREMMRNDRQVARNPEGNVPFMLNAPGKSNQDNLGFGTKMKMFGAKLAGANQRQFGGEGLHRFLPEALLAGETPVSLENNPANSNLKMPIKSSKEVVKDLADSSMKKLEGEANYMPDEYTVDYKAKNKWLGDRQGLLLSTNAFAEGIAGGINRLRDRPKEAQLYSNFNADTAFARSARRKRGEHDVNTGIFRPDEQGQTWGSMSAKYGGNSNYSEGAEVDMTEEELAEFLANGGEVKYLNY